MRRYLIATLAIALGCFTGPAPNAHVLATSGRGSLAVVRTPKATLKGELLEVRDTALVIATGTNIVVVRNDLLRHVRFEKLEDYYVHGRTDSRMLRTFTRLSRFPAGAPPGMIEEIARVTNKPMTTQER